MNFRIFLNGGKRQLLVFFLMTGFFSAGCAPEVYKQHIPVSTNPMGARVYVDGKPAGETPTTVELERTQSHVLTLVKENYRQKDVVIKRKKKSDEQLFKAINSGVSSGLFFKDPAMGMMSGMDSYNRQERTGEAYVLYPSAVTVNLEPLGGQPGGSGQLSSNACQSAPPEISEPQEESIDSKAAAKAVLGAAAVAGAAAVGSREKRWETSSSTNTSVRPDGTVVTEKKSTSVGVSVNPAGVFNLIDTLYK